MEYKIIYLAGLIFMLSWKPAISDQEVIFNDDLISFSYSTILYSDVTSESFPENLCKDPDVACLKVHHIDLLRATPLGGLSSDSGNVCTGPVSACAGKRSTFGYFINEDGEVNASPPGEPMHFFKSNNWEIIETHPLCQWSDQNEGFEPYGGQCYSVVMMSPKKTIGFNFLLGKAGCKDIFKCWPDELARIRKMIDSVR